MTCSTSSFSWRELFLVAAVVLIAAQGRSAGEVSYAPVRAEATADLRIAILPPENLSGVRAPLPEIGQLLAEGGRNGGFELVEESSLAEFMRAHRLRYTGGVTRETARAGREEIGADAILVTSLETFREVRPPRVTLHGRLVSTGDEPWILWADSVGLAGDEAPGLLGLGRITDPRVLLAKAVHTLMTSMVAASREWRDAADATAREEVAERRRSERHGKWSRPWPGRSPTRDVATRYQARFRPRTHFRSKMLKSGAPYTVAVIPFLNISERKHADKILTLHIVNELRRHRNLRLVEPGMVRERLLQTRSIMAGGPSLAVADLFFRWEFPETDLIFSGQVFDYQDREGIPKVDFSLQVFEKTTRRMVWFSRSLNEGDEDVLFFDLGRLHTAHGLITQMARRAVDLMMR